MQFRTFAAFVLAARAGTATAQSTAFTYQGRLKNGAALSAGLHDFRFRLWDVAADRAVDFIALGVR